MTSTDWDERYRAREPVWGWEPNVFVAEQVAAAGLGSGAGTGRTALDLACGEGRHALWLASQGWTATGVDFSAEGLATAADQEAALRSDTDTDADTAAGPPVEWIRADATTWRPRDHSAGRGYDLVVLAYLQLPAAERRAALGVAAEALAPGGTLVVVAHDSANLDHGAGGPRDPAVLYTPDDVVADLAAAGAPIRVDVAETRKRPVEAAERPALDAVVRCTSTQRIVEVFADVGCPFTHVGLRRFVEARAGAGRDDVLLRVRSWPLEVVNGTPLDPRFIADEVDDLREQAVPGMFAGFRVEAFPSTSLPAMALAAAALRAGDRTGEQVSLELRALLFERGRDISDPSVLRAVAEEHGLEVHPGDHHAVLADHREGVARGVIGSPHFFTPGRGWFCPALDISRDSGGHLRIQADPEGFHRFLAASLS
jgi:SAM-dependent methyltransferase